MFERLDALLLYVFEASRNKHVRRSGHMRTADANTSQHLKSTASRRKLSNRLSSSGSASREHCSCASPHLKRRSLPHHACIYHLLPCMLRPSSKGRAMSIFASAIAGSNAAVTVFVASY